VDKFDATRSNVWVLLQLKPRHWHLRWVAHYITTPVGYF